MATATAAVQRIALTLTALVLLASCGSPAATTARTDAAGTADTDAANGDQKTGDTAVVDTSEVDTSEVDTAAADAGADAAPGSDAQDTVDSAGADDAEDVVDGAAGADTGGNDAADATGPAPCTADTDCQVAAACLLGVCGPKGVCQWSPKADASPCDDGNACTTQDQCQAGQCQGGGTLNCDDANPCTADQCNSIAGCLNLPVAATQDCEDGDPCTQGDTCQAGACQPGLTVCQCKTTSDCAKFEDGNLCNGSLYCDKSGGSPYTCKLNPASLVVCPASQDSPCQKNTCVPATGECKLILAPGNTPCDDGDSCTLGDFCEQGLCLGGTNTCYCKQDGDCASFEDGNLCNGTLFCNKATSQCQINPVTVVTCKTVDDTFCSRNTCSPKDGKCYMLPAHEGKACDDGNACTPNELCTSGACTTATNTCECQNDVDCKKKDDDNLCNGTLYCDVASNSCKVNPATVVKCDTDGDPACLQNTCDPKLGKCQQIALPKDGTACDDGNVCTPSSSCSAGSCVATTNTCQCQTDADCAAKEDGDLCNGTLYCNQDSHTCAVNPATVVECPAAFDDTCLANTCDKATGACGMHPVHQGNQCEDGSVCSSGGWCNLGTCEIAVKMACECTLDSDCAKLDDGDLCNGTLYCDVGKAGSKPHCAVNPATVVACPTVANTACAQNVCQATTGKCAMTAVTGSCDDGLACTQQDSCDAGVCKGLELGCSDGDACTADSCIEPQGCVHLALAASACDDGQACTGDSCDKALGCVHALKTGGCDDGKPCTSGDQCKDGACLGSPTDCSDGNPCSDDSCDPQQGCQHAANSAPCSDGNACTDGDACKAGQCQSGAAKNCDDGLICSDDSCDPAKGCVHVLKTGGCDDGKPCTTGDQCKDGVCAGAVADCGDGNPCTDDSCDAQKGCQHLANSAPCSDGSACTDGDACKAGTCVVGAAKTCDDSNPCTDNACDPKTGCTTSNNASKCDDGNACTGPDVCSGGQCIGASSGCSDGNACTDDSCQSGQCQHPANSASCSDGNACTTGDVCAAGKCQSSGVLDCDDKNPCTADSCDAGSGCAHVAAGSTCDDSSACTSQDACSGGYCLGLKVDCDDQNPCTTDSCDSGKGCLHAAATGTCSDGDACTLQDSCKNGLCAAGTPVDCDDANLCTTDSCDSQSGACKHVDASASLCGDGNPCTDDQCSGKYGCGHVNNTAACTDNNPCTIGDGCSGGACVTTGTLNCDDGKVCTDDSCDVSQGCVYANNTAGCDDGNGCTQKDVCSKGKCAGTLSCDDLNPCTDDACNLQTGTCENVANTAQCDDGNACTSQSHCKNGACNPEVAAVCDDNNACTDNVCDKQKGCLYPNNTAPCQSNSCTAEDACSAGSCASSGKSKYWEKIFPDLGYSHDDFLTGGVPLADGALFVGSSRPNSSIVNGHAFILALGQAGTIKTYKAIDTDLTSTALFSIAAVGDGTYVVAGAYAASPNYQGFAQRIDATGNSQWRTLVDTTLSYGVANGTAAYDFGKGVAMHPTKGEFVLCGYGLQCNSSACTDEQGWLFALNTAGQVLGSATYDNQYSQRFEKCAFVSPSIVVTVGSNNEPGYKGNSDAEVVYWNYPALTKIASVHLGTAFADELWAVAALGDGTFWVGGELDNTTPPTRYVARLNASGTTLASKAFTGSSGGVVTALFALPDGSVTAAGAFGSSGLMQMQRVDVTGYEVRQNVLGTSPSTVTMAAATRDSTGAGWLAGAHYTGNYTMDPWVFRVDPWQYPNCIGACGSYTWSTCDDANGCTTDGCGNDCTHTPIAATCDDGNACTSGDGCTGTTCAGSAVVCNDNNACTVDSCDPKTGCVAEPYPDGFVCATGKTCQGGKCQ